jgi:hypothetical protein
MYSSAMALRPLPSSLMVVCALVNRIEDEADPYEVESQDQAGSQNDRGYLVAKATGMRTSCVGKTRYVGDYGIRAGGLVVLHERAQLHLVGGPYFFAHGLDDRLAGHISYWYHSKVVYLRDVMPGSELHLIHDGG